MTLLALLVSIAGSLQWVPHEYLFATAHGAPQEYFFATAQGAVSSQQRAVNRIDGLLRNTCYPGPAGSGEDSLQMYQVL